MRESDKPAADCAEGAATPPIPETKRDQGEYQAVLRDSDGLLGWVVTLLAVTISLGHIWMNTVATLPPLLHHALHFAGFALLCALLYPIAQAKTPGGRWILLALDLAIGLVAAGCALYLIASEDAIYARGVTLSLPEWIAGIVLILTAMELTRRTTGWIIPTLILLALSYATWLGPLVPGVFKFTGLSAETILFRSIYGDDGMFGSIARISATVVMMFILFGAFLLRSGAGDFVIDLARCVAGRLVGGPGLVAVLASGLTGTISGSAVANTAQTGTITIPLMKKTGYSARFAAGVEAAASTGGQLMPPIMGAGAFIMANYTQISYTSIIAVAALPAILYFLSVAFFVRIEAKRLGLKAEESADAPRLGQVLRRGGMSFAPPIVVLIGMLIAGFTPTYAAGIATLAVVAGSWLTPRRMGPKAIVEALVLGARNMTMTAVLLVTIGLFVNVIPTTGIGNIISLMIQTWADGNLLIALVLIALASLVLGMGLPVTAAYVVLAVLSAPALQGLIVDGFLIDHIAAGDLGEQAKTMFMLVDSPLVGRLGEAMTTDEASALLAAVDPNLKPLLRDAILSTETIVLALLSAHMIIFWLSQDSNVTPPVCLTAFTAAAIAKTGPMATGFEAWKIAKGLYVIPLLFAYTPFLGGSALEVVSIFCFAALGLYAFSSAFQGHMEAPLNPLTRVLALGFAAALLWPNQIWVHLAGAAAFLAFLVWNWRRSQRLLV